MNPIVKITCIVVAVLSGLAGLGISVWLGASAFVPEKPWHKRNIAAGVLLVVFCEIIAVICGVLGGLFSVFFCGICSIFSKDDDDCCCC